MIVAIVEPEEREVDIVEDIFFQFLFCAMSEEDIRQSRFHDHSSFAFHLFGHVKGRAEGFYSFAYQIIVSLLLSSVGGSQCEPVGSGMLGFLLMVISGREFLYSVNSRRGIVGGHPLLDFFLHEKDSSFWRAHWRQVQHHEMSVHLFRHVYLLRDLYLLIYIP